MKDPAWRDDSAEALVLKHLDSLDFELPALVAGDPLDGVSDALARRGSVRIWRRRVAESARGLPWPPPGPAGAPFRTAFLRLPKAKDELEMTVHAAASRLGPGARLFVYGANDEGAGSAGGRIEPVFEGVRTVATGGRCRILTATRPAVTSGGDPLPEPRAPLRAWRLVGPPPHPAITSREWVSYPGVFGAGPSGVSLDAGTALLLDWVEAPAPGARVLDFACGDGVIGAVLAARAAAEESGALDLVATDSDAVAVEAARENLPGAEVRLGDGWNALEAGADPFDLIVSNPPYHAGKGETLDVVRSLIAGAPARLSGSGTLVLVAQRRLPVTPLLEAAFRDVDPLADSGPFRVWRAGRPRVRGFPATGASRHIRDPN